MVDAVWSSLNIHHTPYQCVHAQDAKILFEWRVKVLNLMRWLLVYIVGSLSSCIQGRQYRESIYKNGAFESSKS